MKGEESIKEEVGNEREGLEKKKKKQCSNQESKL